MFYKCFTAIFTIFIYFNNIFNYSECCTNCFLCCDKYFTKEDKKQINSDDFASSYTEHVKQQSFKEKNFPHILSKAPWCFIVSSINSISTSKKLVDYFINMNNLPQKKENIVNNNINGKYNEELDKEYSNIFSFKLLNIILKTLQNGYSIRIDDLIGKNINKHFLGSIEEEECDCMDVAYFFRAFTDFINYDNLQNYKLYLSYTDGLYKQNFFCKRRK